MPEILFGLDDGTLYYANSFLEQIQKISVALCFHLCVRHKAQGRTVDAVAHAIGGLRIAGEHMTKVRISGTASDLRAANSVAQILFLHHGRALNGLCKGGPAAAALVLIRGGKERLAGDDIHIDALFKLIPELACESALRAALLRNTVRFDTSRFLLSGEAGLTPTLRAPWAREQTIIRYME